MKAEKPATESYIMIIGIVSIVIVFLIITVTLIWRCCYYQNPQNTQRNSVAEVDQNPEYGSEYYYEETEIVDNNEYYQI